MNSSFGEHLVTKSPAIHNRMLSVKLDMLNINYVHQKLPRQRPCTFNLTEKETDIKRERRRARGSDLECAIMNEVLF